MVSEIILFGIFTEINKNRKKEEENLRTRVSRVPENSRSRTNEQPNHRIAYKRQMSSQIIIGCLKYHLT